MLKFKWLILKPNQAKKKKFENRLEDFLHINEYIKNAKDLLKHAIHFKNPNQIKTTKPQKIFKHYFQIPKFTTG